LIALDPTRHFIKDPNDLAAARWSSLLDCPQEVDA
jgi:hypothetical protein